MDILCLCELHIGVPMFLELTPGHLFNFFLKKKKKTKPNKQTSPIIWHTRKIYPHHLSSSKLIPSSSSTQTSMRFIHKILSALARMHADLRIHFRHCLESAFSVFWSWCFVFFWYPSINNENASYYSGFVSSILFKKILFLGESYRGWFCLGQTKWFCL